MKNTDIRLRISEREKEEIKKKAAAKQMNMSEYILYCIKKNESEEIPTEKYSVEIVRNNELLENSAVYFSSEKEIFDYCKKNLKEEDEDKYYISTFDTDTWYYDMRLTKKVNESEEK